MEAVLREREALYQDVAHYVVDATQAPAVIVSELVQTLSLPAA